MLTHIFFLLFPFPFPFLLLLLLPFPFLTSHRGIRQTFIPPSRPIPVAAPTRVGRLLLPPKLVYNRFRSSRSARRPYQG